MTLNGIIIVAGEAVSFLAGLIILFGMIIENKHKTKTTFWFVMTLVATMAALVFDGLCWIFDAKAEVTPFLTICYDIALALGADIIMMYSMYEIETISLKEKISWKYKIFPIVINTAAMLATIIGSFFGLVYDIVDGVQIPGPLYNICMIAALITLIYLLFITIKHAKILGKHDTIIFSLYLAIPFAAYAMQVLIPPHLEITYIAAMLAVILVYVMLQAGQMSQMAERQAIYKEFSYVDALTGLNNRRAYDEALNAAPEKTTVAVAFCDLNRLKYTNDNLGHEAGDKLLLELAALLQAHFEWENIYRISGDEFVILEYDVDNTSFISRMETFGKEVADREEITAFGYALGDAGHVMEVVKSAEEHMYTCKEQFYTNHPEYDMRMGSQN